MKAVDNGAALLDERVPGWRDHIEPSNLHLEDCWHCILGQLFNTYDRGVSLLGIESEGEAKALGFLRPHNTTWERLTNAWRRKIGTASR